MKLKKPHLLLFTASLITIFFFSACEKVIDPPQQTISVAEADRLEEEFKGTRAKILNAALGFEDTRDFWFSIDTLKKYIAYVEQQGKKMGKENLGIRIYFAAYPEKSDYPDPGYATVFLVPTSLEEPSNLKRGFFPIEPTNQNIDSLYPLNFGGGGIPPNEY